MPLQEDLNGNVMGKWVNFVFPIPDFTADLPLPSPPVTMRSPERKSLKNFFNNKSDPNNLRPPRNANEKNSGDETIDSSKANAKEKNSGDETIDSSKANAKEKNSGDETIDSSKANAKEKNSGDETIDASKANAKENNSGDDTIYSSKSSHSLGDLLFSLNSNAVEAPSLISCENVVAFPVSDFGGHRSPKDGGMDLTSHATGESCHSPQLMPDHALVSVTSEELHVEEEDEHYVVTYLPEEGSFARISGCSSACDSMFSIGDGKGNTSEVASAQPDCSIGESSFSISCPLNNQVPYSGNLSLRSDSSTASMHSFAFPILQGEWISSPVKMKKADNRVNKKRENWRRRLTCCRF